MVKRGKRIAAMFLAAALLAGSQMPAVTTDAVTAELPSATNVSFDTARNLIFGTSIAEDTSDDDQNRYYTFSAEEAMQLTIGAYRQSTGYMDVTVFDQTQTEVWKKRVYTGSNGNSVDIFLTGGTYYLKVNCDGGFGFTATKNLLGETVKETQESNNDFISDATAINYSKKYKGVLAANDAIDYYKFSVSARGKINLASTNGTDNELRYVVYDSGMNMVQDIYLGASDKMTTTIDLVKGEYYLAVTQKKIGDGVGSYTIQLGYLKSTPAKAKISSVQNSGKKKMSVTWNKVSDADGYTVQYCNSSSFKKGVVTKRYASTVFSASYSKLKKKKNYYVRVRAYMNDEDTEIVGKWSAVKKIKIKR